MICPGTHKHEGSGLFQPRNPDPAVFLWVLELGGRGSFRAEGEGEEEEEGEELWGGMVWSSGGIPERMRTGEFGKILRGAGGSLS